MSTADKAHCWECRKSIPLGRLLCNDCVAAEQAAFMARVNDLRGGTA